MDWLDVGLIAVKVGVVFFGLLISVMAAVYAERKVIADMQTRLGPMRAGPRGSLIALADGVKLFFKEGITPTDADRWVFVIAPSIALVPAFLAFAVVPFGSAVSVFGRTVTFQVADLSVGVLWILAMSSLAVYGIVLAGWSSGSRYPLLGAVRSTAQMISYEIALGLSLVAVLMWAGTLSMSEIVAQQAASIWNVVPQFPAFCLFLVAGLAETNRPPFDLPEAESELVAGYFTEYSGIKFAMFYLAEYLHTITIAAVAVTLFLGGPLGPHISFLPWLWPFVWFLLKVCAVVYFFIWVRATLPRIRYDRLMRFGWKVLIPLGLAWIVCTGFIIAVPPEVDRRLLMTGLVVLFVALLAVTFLWPAKRPAADDFPVPPSADADVDSEEVSV